MRLLVVLLLVAVGLSQASAETPPPHRDRYGDPLPQGSLLRLGTNRHRVVGESFAFTPDGASIVAIGWGREVWVFDARTGATTDRYSLPIPDARSATVFADASRVLVVRQPKHSADKGVWEVWDLKSRKFVRRVGPAEIRLGICEWRPELSPDGRTVAYHRDSNDWSRASSFFAADVESGETKEIATLPGPIKSSVTILGPTFTSDGRYVVVGACASEVCELRGWDTRASKLAWSTSLPWPESPQLEPTADGRMVLYGKTRAISLDPRSGKTAELEMAAPLRTHTLRFLPGGRAFTRTFPDDEYRLHLWDWPSGRSKSPAEGWDLGAGMHPVASAPDGDRILLSDGRFMDSPARRVRLLDLANGRQAWDDTFSRGHAGPVRLLRFSADGTRLVSSAEDGTVRVWNLSDGRLLGTWPCARSTAFRERLGPSSTWTGWSDAAFADLSPDGKRLAFHSAATSKTPIRLCVVDVDTGRTVAAADIPGAEPGRGHDIFVGAMAFDGSGAQVAVTFGDYNSVSRDLPTQSLLKLSLAEGRWSTTGQILPAPLAQAAVSRADGMLFVGGRKIDLFTGRKVLDLGEADRGPFALSAGDTLVAGVRASEKTKEPLSGIRELRLWDARTGGLVAAIPWSAPAAAVDGAEPDDLRWAWPRRLALHPTGRVLATSDFTGVQLWDVVTGTSIHRYEVGPRPPLHIEAGSPATALAFTPDGGRLVTGLHDGTILFWPVPTPARRHLDAREEDLWADLVGESEARGWAAAWQLGDDPGMVVRLVRDHVKPVAVVTSADLEKWLSEADSSNYRRREAATRKLETAIDRIAPALSAAANARGVSAELRERLTKVLEKALGESRPLPAWAAAQSRVVAALEFANTESARQTLKDLAAGAPGAWLTREASAALSRLAYRPADKK